ncbi:endoplasmic reticulum resident protein 27 isoform X3 [Acinonyx jubatus]|uniref:Endoplasmic reticulum resident protein 27 isoform X3 n=1 Tax=Acinonyx jubatus TaxID=32536 RepID=A0ABM3QD36_ACIJB|nr:endoplasmic reticulum resident protein 27 isoform X3 [Acinonyx jubatus]
MEADQCRFLFLLFLFMCQLSPEVAAEVQESSDDPGASRETVQLTDVPATMEFIAAAEVAVIGFFQDLEIPAVSLFHSMVQKFQAVSFGISTDSEVLAHYNITGNTISLFRLTAIGLFNSMIQIHLLLMMNKASPEYEESMHRYQNAAKLFQGKTSDRCFPFKPLQLQILFILVDSGVKANGKVISFFKLKESQLPALAIYRTLDEEWDTLPRAEVSVENVQNFCDGFLGGKRLRENHESEEKTPKVEL